MNKNEIIVIKKTETIKPSKQIKDSALLNTVEPNISFKDLLEVYYGSFIIYGIINKITSGVNSGFICENEELEGYLNDSFDISFFLENLLVCGNTFAEVIRTGDGKVSELKKVLVDTIKVKADRSGYIQQVGINKVEFNNFNEKTNPELNEIYHFKLANLSSSYYGRSIFEAVINEVSLLKKIDEYLVSFFENGLIKTKIFTPKIGVELTEDVKNKLADFFTHELKGGKNAFKTALLPCALDSTDLAVDLDIDALIKKKKDLIESVAIALGVPIDLLLPNNSNRATATVSEEQFNRRVIKELQRDFLQDLKTIFAGWDKVDTLEFREVDTKDQKEEAEVYKMYVEAGILAPNEVREDLGFEAKDGGDDLIKPKHKSDEKEAITKEEKAFDFIFNSMEDEYKKSNI